VEICPEFISCWELGTSAFESGCAAPARPLVSDVVKKDYPSQFKNSWFGHASIVTCSRDGSAIIWTPRPRKYHGKVGRWVKAYHLRVPPPPMPPPAPRGNGPRQRLLPTPRGVNMIVWSLDNRFVLAAIMDHRICVWNAVDGSLVHSLTGHDKQVLLSSTITLNPKLHCCFFVHGFQCRHEILTGFLLFMGIYL
jgi:PH-interacting protein